MKVTIAKNVEAVEATVRAEVNQPQRLELVIRVDAPNGLPSWSDYLYECEEDSLYMGFYGHLVQYFAYSEPGRGYGGARVDITMMDGESRTLIGPWSSRTGVINYAFKDTFTPCVDVRITTGKDLHKASQSATLTLNKAISIAKTFGLPLKLESKTTLGGQKYHDSVPETVYWFELDKEEIQNV